LSNNDALILFFLENILIPIGQICIILFGFMGIFLLIKYKTWSFFSKASKKELVLFKTGALGFILIGIISIILAILSN